MTIVTVRVVNTYGGSPLNRLSWLRTSHSFLNAVVTLPGARWMLFKSGQPLLIPSHANKESFKYLRTQDVAPLLGSQPYFGQGQNPGDSVTDEDVAAQKHSPLESIRHIGAPVVFLGVNETERDVTTALPTSELKDPLVAVKKLQGEPYFALDVAELGWAEDEIQEKLDSLLATEGRTYTWAEPRSLMSSLDSFTAAVFASARSMLDWNLRNKVSGTCACGFRLQSLTCQSSFAPGAALALTRCGAVGRSLARLSFPGRRREGSLVHLRKLILTSPHLSFTLSQSRTA
jgi:NAD+ diphosphatase